MGILQNQRTCKRAPFYESIFVLDDENLFLADSVNISETGILISNLRVTFSAKNLHFMFPLVDFPEFLFMDREKIFLLHKSDFPCSIYRCQGELRRKKILNSATSVNYLEVGVSLSGRSSNLVNKIKSYVETFEKNIEFVLMLYQEEMESSKELIRIILSHLGYDCTLKLSVLRSQILHDYNSLLKL